MKVEDLSKEFLRLEFEKNLNVNYIVRCMVVGDEEEIQILEKEFDNIKIINENISEGTRENINTLLKNCIDKYNNDNVDEAIEDLEPLLEILKPYVTWPELYESNFNIWECLVCESFDMLEEILEDMEEEGKIQ